MGQRGYDPYGPKLLYPYQHNLRFLKQGRLPFCRKFCYNISKGFDLAGFGEAVSEFELA